MSLPTEAALRKEIPLASGFLDYFPDAAVAVAQLSMKGNEQHNPGKPLHWDRSKSGDEADALVRHLLQRGTVDTDGVLHDVKVAWRAMAMLQKTLERRHFLPAPRGTFAPAEEPRDDVVDAFASLPSLREVFQQATYEDGVKDEEDEAVPVFHPGELVHITQNGTRYEGAEGFDNVWVTSMDKAVGLYARVEKQDRHGVMLALPDDYYFPPQVLERVHGD